jgi:hypothetical protein
MRIGTRWVFLGSLAMSLLGLVRVQLYSGTIYRGWDAQFYYALARSLAFDRDADISDDLVLTPWGDPFDPDKDGSFRDVPRRPDGHLQSKYPIGMSIAEAPWLALGSGFRAIAEAAGIRFGVAPGFTPVEIWTVAVGLVAGFSVGLAGLYKLLAERFGGTAALLGVLSAWWGTSLFYYSSLFPFMAHAVSFALLAAMMILTDRLGRGQRPNRALVLLGTVVGMLFLVRPQQAVVALFIVPVFVQVARRHPWKAWLPGLLGGAALGAAAIGLQVAFNFNQTGRASLGGYSAGGEGFDFASPNLTVVLISGSRGLFVFSPVVALALLGYALARRSIPAFGWVAAANFLAQADLTAAWSSPEQGDSFGARMLADNAGAVAVGVAALFARLGKPGRAALGLACLGCAAWTMRLLLRYMTG